MERQMTAALSMNGKYSGRKGGARPRVVAIVPAAGYGKRLGSRKKKPFVLLKGKPLVVHALRALERSRAIDGIIIAAEKPCLKHFKALVKKFKLGKVMAIAEGGPTRFESVRNCLELVDDSFDIVLIHDGARPLVEEFEIAGSIALARKYGSCISAVPESDTVKLSDKKLFIKRTLDRSVIFRAKTPQAFKRSLIKRAYEKAKGGAFTDDASLIESLGGRVKIFKGSYKNIKITTKEDLKLAEVILCG